MTMRIVMTEYNWRNTDVCSQATHPCCAAHNVVTW